MTGSDAAGLLLSLRSPTLSPPKGPAALSPSPEPRQSFISRDSALEDLGLWDFGTEGRGGGRFSSSANSCPRASRGQGAGSVYRAGTRTGLDGGTGPRAGPSSRGKRVSLGYRRKDPGPGLVPAALLGRQAVCEPSLPSWDSPWSKRAAGGVI